jgi:hypothetical protein
VQNLTEKSLFRSFSIVWGCFSTIHRQAVSTAFSGVGTMDFSLFQSTKKSDKMGKNEFSTEIHNRVKTQWISTASHKLFYTFPHGFSQVVEKSAVYCELF